MKLVSADEVNRFWFEECEPKNWFAKDENFDEVIRKRFESTYYAATRCELYSWRSSAEGRLAEIIILDQFSRNMFRDQAQAFAFDSLALALTQEAILQGVDKELAVDKRKFLYMPLMHSESLNIHILAEKVFSQPGLEDNLDYEIRHRKIIQRFGRYPHRNAVLDRDSTEEELVFLSQPGSSF